MRHDFRIALKQVTQTLICAFVLRQLQIPSIVIVIVHAFAKLVDVGEGFFCADVDIALPLFFAERALEDLRL